MQIFRALVLVLLSLVVSFSAVQAKIDDKAKENSKPEAKQKQQLVESVDIQGNRRLRDDDLLYYIKTRAGDVFDPKQLERDLKELLSLNFFDKSSTRVLTEEGVRGGVNVIFEVKELPIIRDLRFEGTKAIQESDILKEFRENRVGISKESVFDPVKAKNGTRVLRELLAAKGYQKFQLTPKKFRQLRLRLSLVSSKEVVHGLSKLSLKETIFSKAANFANSLNLFKKQDL
jgi:outer membrane protein assembly factor BamA